MSLPIDDATLGSRLKFVLMEYADPVAFEIERFVGQFHPDLRLVQISLQHPRGTPDFRRIMAHELYHAISGQTVYRWEWGTNVSYLEGRCGLSVGPSPDSPRVLQHIKPRFWWLNEAITETLTIAHTSNVPKGDGMCEPYSMERMLYDLLRKKGGVEIPEEVFLRAYFGDGRDIASLGRSISRAYAPGFLPRIDRFMENAVQRFCKERGIKNSDKRAVRQARELAITDACKILEEGRWREIYECKPLENIAF